MRIKLTLRTEYVLITVRYSLNSYHGHESQQNEIKSDMGFIRTFGRKEGCRPTNTRTVHSYLYAYNYGMPKRKRPLRVCDRLRLLQLQHKHGFLQYWQLRHSLKIDFQFNRPSEKNILRSQTKCLPLINILQLQLKISYKITKKMF